MWLTSPQHSALPMLLVGRVQTGWEHWHKGSLAWRTETWPSSHILCISGDKTQQVFIFNKEESNSLQSWSLSPEAVEIGEDSMMKASFVECFRLPQGTGGWGKEKRMAPVHTLKDLIKKVSFQEDFMRQIHLRERNWGRRQRGWLSVVVFNDRATMTHLKGK